MQIFYGREMLSFIWLGLSVVLQSAAIAFAKKAGEASLGQSIVAIMLNPWYWAQLIALALQTFCWLLVLRRFPISFAYPFMSLVLVLNLILSWVVFKEEVHTFHVLGILLITSGVAIIAREGAS